jgi:hypothetical protein
VEWKRGGDGEVGRGMRGGRRAGKDAERLESSREGEDFVE